MELDVSVQVQGHAAVAMAELKLPLVGIDDRRVRIVIVGQFPSAGRGIEDPLRGPFSVPSARRPDMNRKSLVQ